jgi:hypothetical protein
MENSKRYKYHQLVISPQLLKVQLVRYPGIFPFSRPAASCQTTAFKQLLNLIYDGSSYTSRTKWEFSGNRIRLNVFAQIAPFYSAYKTSINAKKLP